ncbi:hypothetical protein [Thermomonas paludicola]|uniref:hypothetical protein n=1 Tax=Thermomonas paludicola TaxID=2884874 RepID=UPI002114B0F7|nr:hypothetical protein [Thermomonas paludicola]
MLERYRRDPVHERAHASVAKQADMLGDPRDVSLFESIEASLQLREICLGQVVMPAKREKGPSYFDSPRRDDLPLLSRDRDHVSSEA